VHRVTEALLIIYQDRWVANRTRDDLIAARGHRVPKGSASLSDDWKPTMFVDEDKIPHGFCISELSDRRIWCLLIAY